MGMASLNDPAGFEEREEESWTPAAGLRRGLIHGLVVAVILALVLGFLGVWLMGMVIPWHMRSVLAFGVGWILFVVVQRAAGMVGRDVTTLAVGLTVLALVLQHAVFAVFGIIDPVDAAGWFLFPVHIVQGLVGSHEGRLIGIGWFHPLVLVAVNGFPVVGIVFAAVLRQRG